MSVPIYVPGRQINCTRDAYVPEFHTHGWCAPEPDLTWINGVEGELGFSIRRPADRYTFRAEVTPLKAGGIQTLEVFFNFFRIAYFEIGHTTTVEMTLPAELFILRIARVVLHCRNALPGTAVGLSDPRRLGIAVRGWIIE